MKILKELQSKYHEVEASNTVDPEQKIPFQNPPPPDNYNLIQLNSPLMARFHQMTGLQPSRSLSIVMSRAMFGLSHLLGGGCEGDRQEYNALVSKLVLWLRAEFKKTQPPSTPRNRR